MGRKQVHFEDDECSTEDCSNTVAKSGYNINGTERWRDVCYACHKGKYGKPWLLFRKKSCESCGHTPLYAWAMEVHHRDGNKDNNDGDNLMSLCSNCHRDLGGLIHELDGDWAKAESVFKKLVKAMFR